MSVAGRAKGRLMCCGCGLLVLTPAVRARADLKVMVEVSVSGMPEPARRTGKAPTYPRQVTTYYRGDRARIEVTSGPITLYDYAADRVYILDPEKKTYTTESLRRVSGQPPAKSSMVPVPRTSSQSKMVVTLSAAATGEQKTIAGSQALRFTVTGSIDLERSMGSGAGFPAGSQRRGGSGGALSPPIQVDGELWLADESVPTGIDPKYSAPLLPAFAAVLSDAPDAKPLIVALMAQTPAQSGIPLASRFTLTARARRPAKGDQSSSPDAVTVVLTSDVKSISTDTLDDTLFALPASYTQAKRR